MHRRADRDELKVMEHPPSPVVYCPQCERHVAGIEQWTKGYGDENHAERLAVLTCPTCEDVFLVLGKGSVDACAEHNDYCWIYAPRTKVLYPPDPAIDPVVPKQIADSYLEARTVFKASAYTAAAIMCRRTLEGICADRGAKGGSLYHRLQDLKDRGIVEPRLHEWADEVLRLLGNNAVHDVNETISREDAQTALDFTKAIVEYLYVFEAAYEKFKQRRPPKPKQTKVLKKAKKAKRKDKPPKQPPSSPKTPKNTGS